VFKSTTTQRVSQHSTDTVPEFHNRKKYNTIVYARVSVTPENNT